MRVKGLTEKLTNRELAIALLNLVKKRGIHNFEIKAKESEEESIILVLENLDNPQMETMSVLVSRRI